MASFYTMFSCPSCSAKLKRSEEIVAGILVKCPRCDTEFTVPEEQPTRSQPRYDVPAPAPRPSDDYGRPPRYRDPEPDEDIPPRLDRGYGGYGRGRYADLSGNYQINIGKWFSQASNRWGEFLGPAIGYAFILLFITIILAVIPIIGPIVNMLFNPALTNGPAYAAVRVLRRERWEFNDFFSGFQRWGSLWVLNFFVGILSILLIIPFAIGMGGLGAWMDSMQPRPDPALGVIMIFAIGIVAFLTLMYFWTRWMFAWLLVIDQRMDAAQAMSASWKLTRDKVLPLFGFNLLRGLVLFAGVLLCYVGVLFTMPLYILLYAAAYLGATQQTETDDREERRRDRYDDYDDDIDRGRRSSRYDDDIDRRNNY